MTQELVKCPCCEKMVPKNDVELTFRRPDNITALDSYEIEEKCKYNDDIYIYDNQDFYIRCVLDLPVQDKGGDYCLGVWVKVSEKSLNRILDLWDDENQKNEPPMQGLLANNVPLTVNSLNSDVMIRLSGVTSRPYVTVKNEACSLYQEQTCGITIHRASEYSDLCR